MHTWRRTFSSSGGCSLTAVSSIQDQRTPPVMVPGPRASTKRNDKPKRLGSFVPNVGQQTLIIRGWMAGARLHQCPPSIIHALGRCNAIAMSAAETSSRG